MDLSKTDLKYFYDLSKKIKSITGIMIEEDKYILLENRLRSRLSQLNIKNLNHYLDYIDKNDDEVNELIALVTTHTTTFFRTPKIWKMIQNEILKKWFQNSKGIPFEIWSAACSSGEEPYSAAVVCENFRNAHHGFNYHLLASDIDARVLAKAQENIVQKDRIKINDTSFSEILMQYLVPNKNSIGEESYSFVSKIQNNIDFRVHNLFHNPPALKKFDLVLCRNVLIYFDLEDQKKVINQIEISMQSGGYLIIGEAETLSHIKTKFSPVAPFVYQLLD